ncbi:3-hydroxyacyl-CoA dehydrogenase family protein [Microbacterium sp. AK031]|uniref:3-hydroxyacyl-CoA dehydrogenase family protein n=1 Tax=Microbacterium sp. AK031 TaxID=2723076 RepID=UPI0021670022|nr:3-hydroxyacyl-CoA dehydrogenase family protein [Microbacterium sp. AK031]MCS3844035.1 3-hydroxybutyryl-CoA dehydrogenase [Microbacterium sp. AK031]
MRERGVVLVAGAGTIGRQIAAALALRGATDVRIVDPDPDQRQSAREWIDAFLAGEGRSECSTKIVLRAAHLAPDDAVELAIEAVPEQLELKRAVIAELLRAAPRATVASNSSSMPVSRFVAEAEGEHQTSLARLINLHFYVRPWERRVVELMPSGASDGARVEAVDRFMQQLGFRVFVLRRQSFGLLYNRIWASVKREALAIVDEGIATPAEVDEICRALDPQPPQGPFERMDAVGLDTVQLIERAYAAERGTGVSTTLERLVAQGRVGRKSGGGFFEYDEHEDLSTEGTEK